MYKQNEIYVWDRTECTNLLENEGNKINMPKLITCPIDIITISITQVSVYFLSDVGELYTSITPLIRAFQWLQGFKVASIASGSFHTVIITSYGEVFSWGKGETGALGLDNTLETQIPMKLPLKNALQVSCGTRHSACITASGLFLWGSGSFGQLGCGDMNNAFNPKLLNIQEPKIVSCGLQYTLVLNKKGQMLAFGNNSCGQFGNGSKKSSNIPVFIENIPNFKYITCGYHSAGINESNELYVWGTGELIIPFCLREIKNPKTISLCNDCGYAIDREKNIWYWGNNLFTDCMHKPTIIQIKSLKIKNISNIYCGSNKIFATIEKNSNKKTSDFNTLYNKENIIIDEEDKYKLEIFKLKELLIVKDQEIKSLKKIVNQEQTLRTEKDISYNQIFVEEMKKFKMQCYYALKQEVEKRELTEKLVLDLNEEHKMLQCTIKELEDNLTRLLSRCEIYKEKAEKNEELMEKIRILTEEIQSLKSHKNNDFGSVKYINEVSNDLIAMDSPNISMIYNKEPIKEIEDDLKKEDTKSSSDLFKLFGSPEPIRSISPICVKRENFISSKQTRSNDLRNILFREGLMANGGVKNSLNEIRLRLNLLEENKLELEGKMTNFEKKLRKNYNDLY
ncbi:hypothetical protein SteCoe_21902 [Stentor coeruleus]|uniref:Uncharacterized protein n=1 Tax=Stentor coeruleus TaxID=5963 RepID=A0A1R2BNE9_9CILI|nr:hypothetical protein SteCoe_21902 [Stentor coeruleus]